MTDANLFSIRISGVLDYPTVLDLSGVISGCKNQPVVVIDFSDLRFVRPFGVLWLAEAFKDFITERSKKGLRTSVHGLDEQNEAQAYLMHVGFFKYVGIAMGKKVGEAKASNNLLPLSTKSINPMASLDTRFQTANDQAAILTRVVMGLEPNSPVARHPVRYCFREIIRNVFEHSESNQYSILAQWYQRREVEISVLDKGIGIRRSLLKKFDVENDFSAVRLALEPGVSGADLEAEDSVNSGFGLYVLSELGRRTGGFTLISGSACLNIDSEGIVERQTMFSGTAIRLVLNRPKDVDPVKLIEQIIEDGEALSSSKGRAGASALSKDI